MKLYNTIRKKSIKNAIYKFFKKTESFQRIYHKKSGFKIYIKIQNFSKIPGVFCGKPKWKIAFMCRLSLAESNNHQKLTFYFFDKKVTPENQTNKSINKT